MQSCCGAASAEMREGRAPVLKKSILPNPAKALLPPPTLPKDGSCRLNTPNPTVVSDQGCCTLPQAQPSGPACWQIPVAQTTCPAQQHLQHPPVQMGSKNKGMKHQEPGTNLSFKRSVAIIFAQFHNPTADFLVLMLQFR